MIILLGNNKAQMALNHGENNQTWRFLEIITT